MISRTLSRLLRPYRFQILGVAALTAIAAALEGAQLALFFPVFDALLRGAAAGPLGRLAGIAHRLPWDDLADSVALVLGATLLKFGASLWRDRRLASATGTVQYGLKRRLMALYADSAYPFFLDRKHGQLIYNVTIAATKVATLVQKAAQFLTEVARVAAIGLVLLAAAWPPTLILAGIGAAYLAVTRRISRKVSYHTGRGRVVAGAEMTTVLNEFLAGVRQVMAFGTQPFWLNRFDRHSREFRELYVRDSAWLAVPRAALDLFAVFLLFGGIWVARQVNPQWISHQLPVLALFAMAFLRLLPSLTHLGQLRMEVAGLMGEAEAVHGALAHPVPRPAGGSRSFEGLRREISLHRLGFSYPGRGTILEGLGLLFRKGTVTAVVGPSGAGKSTLAHLLLGLLEPTEGEIRVDGADLRELRLDSWRERIGFVSQEIFVFHGSVAENVAFGRAGFSAEQIRQAARLANAHRFIEALPRGYDTVVGERGMKLSGGQQQRIAIARAVLGNPEILILDEATSFLDAESERLVQEAIERIAGNRTVILIAHRLSTVQRADRIIVLERGRVVEQGRHEELIRAQGSYSRLFSAAPLRGTEGPDDGVRIGARINPGTDPVGGVR